MSGLWHYDGVPTAESDSLPRRLRRVAPAIVAVLVTVVVCLLVTSFVVVQLTHTDHDTHAAAPADQDYVDITTVPVAAPAPAVLPGAATGSYVEHCGTDADGAHRNADNVIADPRLPGGAHHTHDYVGNLSTNAFSTDESLAAAGTTCADGDLSTCYWPVLRVLGQQGPDVTAVGGGVDGNLGRILPAAVDLRFVGSPVSQVVPAPRFLREAVGDPKAFTDGLIGVHPQWTCTGYADRVTDRYPLCPAGSRVVRVFDFPSCWDGRSLDSANHHTHLLPANPDGSCPHATFPIPQLRITLSYDVPAGARYAIDSFPEQRHSPLTDHADYIDVLTDQQESQVVDCLNSGRSC